MKAPTLEGRVLGPGTDLGLLARVRAVPTTVIARRSGLTYDRASKILRGRDRPPDADELAAIAAAILAPKDAA